MTDNKKAFTLIEILIVIVIFWILSTLLFRTIASLIRSNAKIQEEKVVAQALISLQTSINNIAEHYPYINYKEYDQRLTENNWYTSTLYLTNGKGEDISIYGSWDCEETCFLEAKLSASGTVQDSTTLQLTNGQSTVTRHVAFRLLPTLYHTGSQYTDAFSVQTISAPGFWLLWDIAFKKKKWFPIKTRYYLQHFVNLQIPTNNQSSEESREENLDSVSVHHEEN